MCNSGTVQVLHNLTGLPHDAPERAPPPALDATDHDADRDEHKQAPGDAGDKVKIRLAATVFVRGAARVSAVTVVEGVLGDDPVAPALPGLAPPDGAAAREELVLADLACLRCYHEAGAEQRLHRSGQHLPRVDWRRAALQSIDGRVQSTYVARVLISMGFTEAEGRLRWILVPSVLQAARSKG